MRKAVEGQGFLLPITSLPLMPTFHKKDIFKGKVVELLLVVCNKIHLPMGNFSLE